MGATSMDAWTDDLALTMPAPPLGIVSDWRGKKSVRAVARINHLLGAPDKLVEPFGGSGRVTLASGARIRRWSDLNPALVQLARVVRDDVTALAAECAKLPVADPEASELWVEMRDRRPAGRTLAAHAASGAWSPAEFAWATTHTYCGYLLGRVQMRAKESPWRSWVRNLPTLALYLRGVEVARMDWREALDRTPDDWAVYADPPYPESHNLDYGIGDHATVDYAEVFARCERFSVAVVSGWMENVEAPDGWHAAPSPRKPIRERFRAAGRSYRTEVEWVWRKPC